MTSRLLRAIGCAVRFPACPAARRRLGGTPLTRGAALLSSSSGRDGNYRNAPSIGDPWTHVPRESARPELAHAASSGDAARVCALLDEVRGGERRDGGYVIDERRPGDGATCLLLAAMAGHSEVRAEAGAALLPAVTAT